MPTLADLEKQMNDRFKLTWWVGGVVTAAIFTVIGFMYLQFLPALVDSKLTDVKSKVTAQDERLNSISSQISDLKNFQTGFLQEVLKRANAGTASVERGLSITSSTFREARAKKVETHPSLLRPIGSELANVDTSTARRQTLFAEAASEFVNYRSEMDARFFSGFVSPSHVERRPCFPGRETTEERSYRDCLVELSNATIENTTFENAVVYYSGRPIPILRNVTFKNCFFVAQFPQQSGGLARALVGSPEELIHVALFPKTSVTSDTVGTVEPAPKPPRP